MIFLREDIRSQIYINLKYDIKYSDYILNSLVQTNEEMIFL